MSGNHLIDQLAGYVVDLEKSRTKKQRLEAAQLITSALGSSLVCNQLTNNSTQVFLRQRENLLTWGELVQALVDVNDAEMKEWLRKGRTARNLPRPDFLNALKMVVRLAPNPPAVPYPVILGSHKPLLVLALEILNDPVQSGIAGNDWWEITKELLSVDEIRAKLCLFKSKSDIHPFVLWINQVEHQMLGEGNFINSNAARRDAGVCLELLTKPSKVHRISKFLSTLLAVCKKILTNRDLAPEVLAPALTALSTILRDYPFDYSCEEYQEIIIEANRVAVLPTMWEDRSIVFHSVIPYIEIACRLDRHIIMDVSIKKIFKQKLMMISQRASNESDQLMNFVDAASLLFSLAEVGQHISTLTHFPLIEIWMHVCVLIVDRKLRYTSSLDGRYFNLIIDLVLFLLENYSITQYQGENFHPAILLKVSVSANSQPAYILSMNEKLSNIYAHLLEQLRRILKERYLMKRKARCPNSAFLRRENQLMSAIECITTYGVSNIRLDDLRKVLTDSAMVSSFQKRNFELLRKIDSTGRSVRSYEIEKQNEDLLEWILSNIESDSPGLFHSKDQSDPMDFGLLGALSFGLVHGMFLDSSYLEDDVEDIFDVCKTENDYRFKFIDAFSAKFLMFNQNSDHSIPEDSHGSCVNHSNQVRNEDDFCIFSAGTLPNLPNLHRKEIEKDDVVQCTGHTKVSLLEKLESAVSRASEELQKKNSFTVRALALSKKETSSDLVTILNFITFSSLYLLCYVRHTNFTDSSQNVETFLHTSKRHIEEMISILVNSLNTIKRVSLNDLAQFLPLCTKATIYVSYLYDDLITGYPELRNKVEKPFFGMVIKVIRIFADSLFREESSRNSTKTASHKRAANVAFSDEEDDEDTEKQSFGWKGTQSSSEIPYTYVRPTLDMKTSRKLFFELSKIGFRGCSAIFLSELHHVSSLNSRQHEISLNELPLNPDLALNIVSCWKVLMKSKDYYQQICLECFQIWDCIKNRRNDSASENEEQCRKIFLHLIRALLENFLEYENRIFLDRVSDILVFCKSKFGFKMSSETLIEFIACIRSVLYLSMQHVFSSSDPEDYVSLRKNCNELRSALKSIILGDCDFHVKTSTAAITPMILYGMQLSSGKEFRDIYFSGVYKEVYSNSVAWAVLISLGEIMKSDRECQLESYLCLLQVSVAYASFSVNVAGRSAISLGYKGLRPMFNAHSTPVLVQWVLCIQQDILSFPIELAGYYRVKTSQPDEEEAKRDEMIKFIHDYSSILVPSCLLAGNASSGSALERISSILKTDKSKLLQSNLAGVWRIWPMFEETSDKRATAERCWLLVQRECGMTTMQLSDHLVVDDVMWELLDSLDSNPKYPLYYKPDVVKKTVRRVLGIDEGRDNLYLCTKILSNGSYRLLTLLLKIRRKIEGPPAARLEAQKQGLISLQFVVELFDVKLTRLCAIIGMQICMRLFSGGYFMKKTLSVLLALLELATKAGSNTESKMSFTIEDFLDESLPELVELGKKNDEIANVIRSLINKLSDEHLEIVEKICPGVCKTYGKHNVKKNHKNLSSAFNELHDYIDDFKWIGFPSRLKFEIELFLSKLKNCNEELIEYSRSSIGRRILENIIFSLIRTLKFLKSQGPHDFLAQTQYSISSFLAEFSFLEPAFLTSDTGKVSVGKDASDFSTIVQILCMFIFHTNSEVSLLAASALSRMTLLPNYHEIVDAFDENSLQYEIIQNCTLKQSNLKDFDLKSIDEQKGEFELSDSAFWKDGLSEEQNEPIWASELCFFLINGFQLKCGLSYSGLENSFFKTIGYICRYNSYMAKIALPIIFNEAISFDVDGTLAGYFGDWFKAHIFLAAENVHSKRLVINMLNFLRKRHITINTNHRGDSTSSSRGIRIRRKHKTARQAYLLPIDYATVALAANEVRFFASCILYAEHLIRDQQEFDINSEDANQHVTVAKKLIASSLESLNDVDSIVGISTDFVYNSCMLAEYEGRWDKALILNDCSLRYIEDDVEKNSQKEVNLLRSQARFGLYYTFDATLSRIDQNRNIDRGSFHEIRELRYAMAWKLRKWDIGSDHIQQGKPGFHETFYEILRRIRQKHLVFAKAMIDDLNSTVIREVVATESERTNDTFDLFFKLKLLTEPSAICSDVNRSDLDLQWVIDEKMGKESLSTTLSDFKSFETFAYSRLAVADSLKDKDCFFRRSAKLVDDLFDDLDRNIASIRKARDLIQDWKSLVSMRDESVMSDISSAGIFPVQIMFADSRLLWAENERHMALNNAVHILKVLGWDKNSNSWKTPSSFSQGSLSLLRAKICRFVAEWTIALRKSGSDNVYEDFLKKGKEALNQSADGEELCNMCCAMGDFAYNEINKMEERRYCQEFQISERLVRKKEQEALKCYNALKTEKDPERRKALQRHYGSLSAQIQKEEQDQAKYSTRINDWIIISLTEYSSTLKAGNKFDIRSAFRLVSLWLKAANINSVNETVEKMILQNGFPLNKLVSLIYQLACNLGKSDGSLFQATLVKVIFALSKEYPHHCLWHLIGLGNGGRVPPTQRGAAQYKPNKEKVEQALTILDMIRKYHSDLLDQMVLLSDAYIELADYPAPAHSKSQLSLSSVTLGKMRPSACNRVAIPTVFLPNMELPPDWPKVAYFEKSVTLVGGINVPKVIFCVSTNGTTHKQLVKGADDLRQDAVMEQLFEVVSQLLSKSRPARKRSLSIRTYRVVPLTPCAGILEWVVDTIPLTTYLVGRNGNDLRAAHKRYRPGDWSSLDCRKHMVGKAGMDRVHAFEEICEKFKPVFRYFFHEKFPEPTVWYQQQLTYTRSVATSSLVGYIVGLGDRHSANILIDENTSEVIHIDLGIAFEQGKLLRFPERVPFRLTRDIIDAMGVSGYEGTFRRCSEVTLELLKENKDLLLAVIEVFLRDPLYKWALSPLAAVGKQRHEDEDEDEEDRDDQVDGALGSDDDVTKDDWTSGNNNAASALLRIREKLQGYENGEVFNTENHVSKLIQEATNKSNLAQMFEGWAPWI